jgi:hypothetical protein
MKVNLSLVAVLSLLLIFPSVAVGKDKKGKRGMLESMQAVPCGAKQRGVSGLGSLWASVGVEHVNSHEQLCPQYLLRTDDMDYHIRPMDLKHATVLPVGSEAQFKIKKDRLFLKIPDGDKKERSYQVVSMQPVNSDSKYENSNYHPPDRPTQPQSMNFEKGANQATDRPPNQ